MHDKCGRIYGIVKKYIEIWDPAELVEAGAPDSQYESEISQINSFMLKNNNRNELAVLLIRGCLLKCKND